MSTLEYRLRAMRFPPADQSLTFHALTLTASADGRISLGMDSNWVGYQDMARRVELRESRLVTATYRSLWDRTASRYIFVTTEDDLAIFLLAGGHALVERSVAESAFGDLLGPRPVYPSGRTGYVAADALPRSALNKAPSPKLRMKVLQRDGRRCRICGQRPDDDVNVVLHVHHIRPRELGGTTEATNLITLCHTCHTGLDPHFDAGLFDYTQPEWTIPDYLVAYDASVANYRRIGFSSSAASSPNSGPSD